MSKYMTKRTANKILFVGLALWLITFIIYFVILWNIYGLVDSADSSAASHTMQTWSIFAKINMYVQYFSYFVIGAGLLFLLLSGRTAPKQK